MSAIRNIRVGNARRLCILVGAPDPLLRQRLTSALRLQGHEVLEAANAEDMRDRLAEHADQTDNPLDLILCGGCLRRRKTPSWPSVLPPGVRALLS